MRLIVLFFILFSFTVEPLTAQDYLISRPINENANLYHIKPIEFKESRKNKLNIDYTYVHQDTTDKTVSIKMTLISKSHKGIPDTLTVLPSGYSLPKGENSKVMYVEKDGNRFKTRIKYTISFDDFKKYFFEKDIAYKIVKDNESLKYTTKRKRRKDYYEAFDLMLTEIKLTSENR